MSESNGDIIPNGNGHLLLPESEGHGFHSSNGHIAPESKEQRKAQIAERPIPPSNQWDIDPNDPTKLIKLSKFPYEFAGP